MSKILVVYGTGTGCTEEIAKRIGAKLADLGFEAEVASAKDAPAAGAYAAVFVGSGVRAGSWHPPVKEWVTRETESLKKLPVAFFTACLTLASDPAKEPEVRAYTDQLITDTGVTPVDLGVFAGMNEPKRFSFVERTIMKLMKAPTGDFRDWAKIEAWTVDAASKLGLEA